MLNLLRFEAYKLRKSKAFVICFIIAIVLGLLSVLSYNMIISQIDDHFTLPGELLDNEEYDFSPSNLLFYGLMDAKSLLLIFFMSTNTPLLLAIVVSIFIGSEFNNGTIKMMISRGNTRTKIYFSKLIITTLCAYIFDLLNIIISLALGTAVFGFSDDRIYTYFETKDLILVILARAVLMFCIIAFINMFSNFFRNIGGSIAITIALIFMGSLFATILDAIYTYLIVYKLDGKEMYYTFNDLWLFDGLNTFSTFNISNKSWWLLLIFFGIYGVLGTFLGILSFNKNDIK